MYSAKKRNAYERIAEFIKCEIVGPTLHYRTSIFLCGASVSYESSLRSYLTKFLTRQDRFKRNRYEIILPEDLFVEVLIGHNTPDLLSLEGILAESVDVIILIPESPGSIAELGAFANNEMLLPKLICVLDEKHKRDESFINKGPVKLIKNYCKENVVYVNWDWLNTLKKIDSSVESIDGVESKMDKSPADDFEKEVVKLLDKFERERIEKKRSANENVPITLLNLDKFILSALYLLRCVQKVDLVEIVTLGINRSNPPMDAKIITTIVLDNMTRHRLIQITNQGFVLTEKGKSEFFRSWRKGSRMKEYELVLAIDELRLEILNWQNRNRRIELKLRKGSEVDLF